MVPSATVEDADFSILPALLLLSSLLPLLMLPVATATAELLLAASAQNVPAEVAASLTLPAVEDTAVTETVVLLLAARDHADLVLAARVQTAPFLTRLLAGLLTVDSNRVAEILRLRRAVSEQSALAEAAVFRTLLVHRSTTTSADSACDALVKTAISPTLVAMAKERDKNQLAAPAALVLAAL